MNTHFQGRAVEHKRNIDLLVACMKTYASHYKTNQVLFTLGTDFAFQYANLSYAYIDSIVEMVQGHREGSKLFKFKYSTVREYLEQVRATQ
jgi:hypothetical protein